MFDILEFRKKHELTQAQAARFFGISRVHVSFIENGRRACPEYIARHAETYEKLNEAINTLKTREARE